MSRVRVLDGHHCVVALGKLCLHPCASVTKQYNLVQANGVISLAREVTVAWGKVTAAYHRVYAYD